MQRKKINRHLDIDTDPAVFLPCIVLCCCVVLATTAAWLKVSLPRCLCLAPSLGGGPAYVAVPFQLHRADGGQIYTI